MSEEKEIGEEFDHVPKELPICQRCGSQLRNEDGKCICSRTPVEKKKE